MIKMTEIYKLTWQEAIGGIPIWNGKYLYQPFRLKRYRFSIEIQDIVLHKRYRFKKDESWLAKLLVDSFWKSIVFEMIKTNQKF